MIDHRSYPHNSSSCEIKGVPAHDLYDTGAVLYQLSYQANWELATLWVRNTPVQGEEYKLIYDSLHIWTAENKYEDMIDLSSQLCAELKQLRNYSLKKIQASRGF